MTTVVERPRSAFSDQQVLDVAVALGEVGALTADALEALVVGALDGVLDVREAALHHALHGVAVDVGGVAREVRLEAALREQGDVVGHVLVE